MKQEEPKMRITPDQIANSQTIECACGNKLFEEGMIFKKLSPIISPTGREEIFPIQVIVCKKCGKIPDVFDLEGVVPKELLTSKINIPGSNSTNNPLWID
jgi:hypothetical protein